MKFSIFNAAFAALVLCVGSAGAGTFKLADAVSTPNGFDAQNGTITKVADGFAFDTAYDATLFSGNASDALCEDAAGNAVYENGLGFYGLPDCGQATSVTRGDGQTFSVASVDLLARDTARYAGGGVGPQEADYDDYDLWADARYAWAFAGTPSEDQQNRFWVAGSRDGTEIARLKFSAAQSQSSILRLNGFDNIDRLTFGVADNAPSTFIDDFFLVIASASGQGHCYASCETITFRGFDYALDNQVADINDIAIAPVPLPAGLPLLFGGLAVLFGLRRRA